MFKNKKIMVFGGTGTIGTLIVDKLKELDVNIIRIFSNDENSLWEKEQKAYTHKLRFLLGDIRDYERVKHSLKDIDYVFNCAAIKHVPFAEYNPMEAVKTNTDGTDNIIRACIEQKIEKLLHISTDKAVKPTTVMGATKLISERLIQVLWSQNPTIKMVCVRLGNIWNSRGSIIPLVRECKRQNKPFPLTDPEITRYFMQPAECVNFILKAFELGGNGELFIPKLKVVNILDVIHGEVGEDYPYELIGLRKGEKLKEKLLTKEELAKCKEFDMYWVIPNEEIQK